MRIDTAAPFRATFACVAIAAGAFVFAQGAKPPSSGASKEWPTYGHDPGAMRFSPLTEITPANVGQLQVAWV
jgi:glucose dehydrogenase